MSNIPPESGSTSLPVIQETPCSSPVLAGFLRREELAAQLGISPRTIDRWQVSRMGPPRVHVGRTILYNIHSVRDWLQSREQHVSPMKKRRAISRLKQPTAIS
jgi:predicted DNA-binding transcriptional regulator AlpA